MTIWRLHIACWITEATDRHSKYVIRFVFPLQQWLYGRARRYVKRTLSCKAPEQGSIPRSYYLT
jgi:hypothetical protein